MKRGSKKKWKKSPKKQAKKSGKSSAATRLVATVRDGNPRTGKNPFSLFHDPHDQAFVRIDYGDRTEIWPVESTKFRKILSRNYYKSTGQIINRNALGDAINTLAGLACSDGAEERTHLRVARHGKNILIDLCDRKWRVVEVKPDGWQILDTSPVAFVRTGSMQAFPEPEPGPSSLESLWSLMNVNKELRPLVAGCLVNAFHPEGPYFVINYIGEQGTAKTCAARMHRQLVDPSENPLRSPPREENDLFAQAINNRCLALDNLSHLALWLSDSLCRIATGGGVSKRKLYTDADEMSREIKRPIIMNGIEDVAQRPDLAERTVQIELGTIDSENRITEKVLWRDFEKARPLIFTAILNGLVTALRTLPGLDFSERPLQRMADGVEFATAAETALGFERWAFYDAYQKNLDESALTSVEVSPVGRALVKLLAKSKNEAWEGEPTTLLDALTLHATEKDVELKEWPESVLALGHVLRRLAPALRRADINIERTKEKGRRIIKITKKCKVSEEPSRSSKPSSPEAEAGSGMSP